MEVLVLRFLFSFVHMYRLLFTTDNLADSFRAVDWLVRCAYSSIHNAY